MPWAKFSEGVGSSNCLFFQPTDALGYALIFVGCRLSGLLLIGGGTSFFPIFFSSAEFKFIAALREVLGGERGIP